MTGGEEAAHTEGHEATASASAETPQPVIRYGIAAIERRIGLERSTISRYCRAGMFPKPVYLGTRRYWTEEQIAEWEARQFARQAEAVRRVRELIAPAQVARRERAQ